MKKTLVFFLGLFLSSSVFALTSVWQPAVQIRGGGLLCVPTSDYLIIKSNPVRFSSTVGADIEPVSFSFESGWNLSLGASADYSTVSETVNKKFLKSYIAAGPEFSMSKTVSDNLSLGASARFMFAWFTPLYEKFAYFDFSVFGSYTLFSTDSMKANAVVPVSFRYRNDAISFTLGVGMKMYFDFLQ